LNKSFRVPSADRPEIGKKLFLIRLTMESDHIRMLIVRILIIIREAFSMQLYMALSRTFHAQKNRFRPGMAQIGLSSGQPKILEYLSPGNCSMQKDIAAALDIEPATVSQILNNMVQSGLIRRPSAEARKRAE